MFKIDKTLPFKTLHSESIENNLPKKILHLVGRIHFDTPSLYLEIFPPLILACQIPWNVQSSQHWIHKHQRRKTSGNQIRREIYKRDLIRFFILFVYKFLRNVWFEPFSCCFCFFALCDVRMQCKPFWGPLFPVLQWGPKNLANGWAHTLTKFHGPIMAGAFMKGGTGLRNIDSNQHSK